jgi:hypothetical protein
MEFLVQSFKLFVGTYITFLKGYDADYQINTKIPMFFLLKLKKKKRGPHISPHCNNYIYEGAAAPRTPR